MTSRTARPTRIDALVQGFAGGAGRTSVRLGAALLLLAFALCACMPPAQSGELIVLPGSTARLLLAMRLGYMGMGDAKAPARARRVVTKEDLPAGAAASARIGDWMLENGAVIAIVADVDGSARGGQLLDLVRRRGGGVDGLARVQTIVGERRVRYTSAKDGTDEATGAAYLQVTGHPEGDPTFEIVTRYDIAPELAGVVFHTSFKIKGALPGAIGVGDIVSFPAGAARITAGARDIAAFGREASYAVEPLGETPFVISTSTDGGSIGVAPELVTTDSPEEPFLYSRLITMLDRPDELALAATRATAAGHPLGEMEIEVVPLPRRVGNAIAGGSVLLQVEGSTDAPLRMPITTSIRPGDKHLAKLPTGRYLVSFEGGGFRSVKPTAIDVAARGLTPVHVDARRDAEGTDPLLPLGETKETETKETAREP